MRTSFTVPLNYGFSQPVRYKRGEGVNVWGIKINDCAHKLDAMADRLPPEAIMVLRELFEEIGQQTRDAFGLVDQDALNIRL